MILQRAIVVVPALLWLVACSREEATSASPVNASDLSLHSRAEAAVLADLKDPYTAKVEITGDYARKAERVVCGTVNAKNALGAYTGRRDFLVWVSEGDVIRRVSIADGPDDASFYRGFCSDWSGD